MIALYNIIYSAKSLSKNQENKLCNLSQQLVLDEKQPRIELQKQGNNSEDFYAILVENKLIDNIYKNFKLNKRKRLFKVYGYFKKRILELFKDKNNNVDELFNILEKVNEANVVKISVSNYSDAYKLFEAINNRGKPLTAIDIIKNSFLSCISEDKEKDLNKYFEMWKSVIDNIGDDYKNQERFFRHNYNSFYLSDKSNKSATKSNLIDIYEGLIKESPEKFICEIVENSKIYSKFLTFIENNKQSELDKSLFSLQKIGGTPSNQFLLYIIKNKEKLEIIENNIVEIIKFLIAFFVRRSITDVPPTRDLDRIFIGLIKDIRNKNLKANDVFDILRNTLIEKQTKGNQNINELFSNLLSGSIYLDNADATRFILCSLAENTMTDENWQNLWEKDSKNKYVWTIEHVFPEGENIPDDWVKMISDGDKEKAKELQEKYVHCLGNLTLIRFNSNLSDKPFKDKRDAEDKSGKYIGYKNGLGLNEDLKDEETWTVEKIEARTDKLVKQILELFKL